MATISTPTATPASLNTGQTAHVRAVVTPDAAKTATVTITVDGQTGTARIPIGSEPLTFSLNPADAATKGCVVATMVGAGALAAPTLTANPDGTSTFDVTFTAA
jgi:hypothetical protein